MDLPVLSLEYVDRHFPGVQSVLLTGSAADGSMKKHSDVDLLVVSPYSAIPYVVKRQYQGQCMEVVVLPRTNLAGWLERDLRLGAGAYLKMFQQGKVLRDQNQFLSELKKYAQKRYQQGKPMPSLLKYKMQIVSLGNLVDDFDDDRERGELLFIFQQIMREYTQMVLGAHRHWPTKGKRYWKDLKHVDSELSQVFLGHMDRFYRDNDKTPVVKFLREELDKFGGMLKEYSSRAQLPGIVQGDRLHIAVKGDLARLAFIQDFLTPLVQNKELRRHTDSFYFYHDHLLEYKTLICIRGEHRTLRNTVYPILDKALMKLPADGPEKPELYFPEFASLPEHYGGIEARALWEDFLSGAALVLGNIVDLLDEEYDEGHAITFGLFMLISFVKEAFPDPQTAQVFCQHLVDRWLPYHYDSEARWGHEELKEERENSLMEFQSRYEKNPALFDIHRKIFQSYAEFEIEDEWHDMWKGEIRGMLADFQQLADEGKVKALQFEKEMLPLEMPEGMKERFVFMGKAINRVLNQTGVFFNLLAFLPWILLKFDAKD